MVASSVSVCVCVYCAIDCSSSIDEWRVGSVAERIGRRSAFQSGLMRTGG